MIMNSLSLTLNSQKYDLVQNYTKASITGNKNKIRIKSHINTLTITGKDNQIDVLYPNSLVDNIIVTGNSNIFNLNRNCSNVTKNFLGSGNKINFSDVSNNIKSNAGENNVNINIVNHIVVNDNTNNGEFNYRVNINSNYKDSFFKDSFFN